MELGGNAPFIIFDNADLDEAVTGLMGAKFRNAGQTCVAANRIFVQRSVLETVLEKLTDKVAELKVGNGLDDGVDIGPLIYPKAKEKVQTLVQDAVDKGASLIGDNSELEGSFQEPLILPDVTSQMEKKKEERGGA